MNAKKEAKKYRNTARGWLARANKAQARMSPAMQRYWSQSASYSVAASIAAGNSKTIIAS